MSAIVEPLRIHGGLIVTQRCHYCSRHKSPKDIIHLSGGAAMCNRCYEWHLHALDVMAGEPPRGCQVCHLKFDALEERSRDGNVHMQVHVCDGVYAVMCVDCGNKYARQRADLYGDTQWGWQKKLKGAK